MRETELDNRVEPWRDEIAKFIREATRTIRVDGQFPNMESFTRKDLGIRRYKEIDIGGYDGRGYGEDFQKALDHVGNFPQRSRKDREALGLLKWFKLNLAKARLWGMQRGILPKVEYFEIPSWMSEMLPRYLDFINPGGVAFAREGTWEESVALTPNASTAVRGCDGATNFEIQSDINCWELIGANASNLLEHVSLTHFAMSVDGGVASTLAGIRMKYVGDLRVEHIFSIQDFAIGINGEQTNLITQSKFNKIHIYQCDEGIVSWTLFDTRWKDILVLDCTKARAAGGIAWLVTDAAGGDVFDGILILNCAGHGFYYLNGEWSMVKNSTVDDCIGNAWEFRSAGGQTRGLMLSNLWGGSSGVDLDGTYGLTWDDGKGFYFYYLVDPWGAELLQARGNAHDGILLEGCAEGEIDLPICVSNSKLHGGVGTEDKHGIELYDSKYVTIKGGRCTDPYVTPTQQYGIFEGQSAPTLVDYNYFEGVAVAGNVAGTINRTGAHTRIWQCPGHTYNYIQLRLL